MNVLLTGASGLLGGACRRRFAALGIPCDCPSSSELDITNRYHVESWLDKGYDWCVNCAAFALFNECEKEPARAELVNAIGPFFLASACESVGTRMIHFSSDFVFDGLKGEPYVEEDKPNPLSAYGRSKLAGELLVFEALPSAVILRTSWLYGVDGACFVRNILEQLCQGRKIRVVADQFGTPTSTDSLAKVAGEFVLGGGRSGLYHTAGPDVMSWYEHANQAICIWCQKCQVEVQSAEPLRTADWPASAIRPGFSPLDSKKLVMEGILPIQCTLLDCVSILHSGLVSIN